MLRVLLKSLDLSLKRRVLKKMKIWQKNNNLNKLVEKFTVGDDYLLDQNLVKYDCAASIAHVKMLNKIGVFSKKECNVVVKELNEIIKLNSRGSFKISQQDEDCHTAIENHLVSTLGDVGKKIHTGRSRNDQVLAALRLYYKDEMKSVIELVDSFCFTLGLFKEKYGSVKLPGYTHMRKAMPSSVSLWSDAFIDSMMDNKHLALDVCKLLNQSPLGSGAGYGLPIEVDRKFCADLLGFERVQLNPIYVQNSRGKFESSILHVTGQIMFDLNKMASDLILFSMPEFGFFELSSDVCTGSSIMPHKKNPDVLELVRAKYYSVLACEFEVKSIIGNLISGYNRDLQLTKKSVMDGLETLKNSLDVMIVVLGCLKVNSKQCEKGLTKELYSTGEIYKLVNKGVVFRDAYNHISKNYE